jgi:hypothetical protein
VTLDDLLQLLERQRQWIDDLQSGMFVNCVYCGHRYGPRDETPASRVEAAPTMAAALQAHIATCPEHPMALLVKLLNAASSALKSYAHGNAATELAREMSMDIDAVLTDLGIPLVTPSLDAMQERRRAGTHRSATI